MPEPIIETPPVETPPTETPPVEPPVYIGADGTLNEGWKDMLDEDIRGEKTLDLHKNVKTIAKSLVSAEKMVGKDKIAIPTESSTEAEIEAFHKAGGRPDTIEDYNLKAPEDFPVEITEIIFPKEKLSAWQNRFFKAGISKKAADSFIAEFAQDALLDLQRRNQAEEQEMAELKNNLTIEYGAAMEQKKHIGDMAIEEGTKGDFEFKKRLTGKFGNDPDFIRYSVNLGEKFAEGKSPNYTNIPTPSDYQTQIDKIMANPLYLKGTLTERMKLAEQVLALREKMTAGQM